ncbi:autotransporter domain-containing protein [Oceanidesulfovibrio marinus]|uniref:Autotransporter domain-containing protein n=1 Tax=Oceanidesulfovibrio marinus TaxID=370038 RepID=A0ABX6NLI6_9BACT|nr:autotransporter domain-containing protein [Oceanidesulfovibrio marinus]QJT10898.1 autotransporter domain-containing protein [Oceanidesulfovibrio marinus]
MTNPFDTGAGSFRQALVDASSGDTISFAIGYDSTITVSSSLLVNKNVSLLNNSGYSVQLVDATNGHGIEVVSNTVLDIGGASPLTIGASTTGGTSAIGIYTPSGGYTVDSLGENTTINAQAAASNAYGMSVSTSIEIGTLAGAVNATSTDSYASGLYTGSGDIDISTLSGAVSATSTGGLSQASGLSSSSGDINIDTLAGAVNATSAGYNVFGLHLSSGDIDIGTLSGSVSATGTGGIGYAYGLYSNSGNIDIDTLSGAVSATSISSAHGLYSNSGNIDIDTLSGAVSAASSSGYAYGLYSDSSAIDIDTLSGAVSAASSSGYAYGLYSDSSAIDIDTLSGSVSASSDSRRAYGLDAGDDLSIGTLSGTVSAMGRDTAYGLYSRHGGIDIGTLSGSVSATSTNGNAFGLNSDGGDINIDTLSGTVSATVSATGGYHALGLYSRHGGIDIGTLSGSVSATGRYNAYGLYSGGGDINIDTLSGTVSAMSTDSDAYGLEAGSDLSIGTLSGTVSATSTHWYAYGLETGNDLSIGTLSGSVSATSTDWYAYGLYSRHGDIDITTLSGAVSATGSGDHSDAYGLYSDSGAIDIGTLSGAVSATGSGNYSDAYGLYSDSGSIDIGTLSGTVSARSEDYRAFGIKSFGLLNGGDSATPAKITGMVSAVGGSYASAIEADGATNLYVAGTLYAEDTSGGGNAWAVKTGGADDLLTLATGASITGMVDLGGGADILTLLGSGTATDQFMNIEDLVVGDGSAPTRWEWGEGTGTTHFDAVDILSNAALQVGAGAVINSPVSVHAGGTLGGYGTVAGNVVNSGTVSPGGSIGTLTINGDYTQTAGGALFMELGTYTQDQLVVTGAANLDGALILVPEAGALFRGGTSWTVLTADGGINGGFRSTSILSSSPTLTFQSTQAGGVLSVSTYRSTPYTAFALGERTMGLAQLLTSAAGDATGEMAEMLAGLDFSSGAEISYAMESLSAESYGAFSQSALEGGRALTAAQRAGLRSGGVAPGRTYIGDLNQGGGTSDAPQSTGLAADEAGATTPELTVFLEPFGMHANQGSSSDRVGYDAMTWGLAAGFLYHPTENWTLGIAPGFFSQSLQEDGPGDGDGSVVEWSVAALIGYQTDDFYMDAMARLGFDSFRSNKDLVLPGMPRSADARWNGTNLTFALGGGYDFHAGGFTFGPVGSLAWSNLHEDSFEEKDAGLLGQHIRARNSQSLNTELGARITRTFESEYGDITPELRMVWNAEWLDGGRSITSSFIGYAGGRYSAQLADQRYHSGLLDAGLTWAVTDRFSIVARTSVELFRPDHDSLSGSLRLQYAF